MQASNLHIILCRIAYLVQTTRVKAYGAVDWDSGVSANCIADPTVYRGYPLAHANQLPLPRPWNADGRESEPYL